MGEESSNLCDFDTGARLRSAYCAPNFRLMNRPRRESAGSRDLVERHPRPSCGDRVQAFVPALSGRAARQDAIGGLPTV